ncbi:acyl-CoA dehydrogenase family protein [Streptomyces sp. NPDC102274]|uniref:acyl-CoA dehydrogenase family protein n=1 Tax=Streptomyces sp. NPDC102274 TaxID=3366151 RepID=UPI00380A2F10
MGTGFTTEAHEQLRARVREFAESEIEPEIPRMEAERRVERDLVSAVARRGWVGVTVTPEDGITAVGHLAKTVIVEELSRVSGAIGAAVQALQLGVAKISHYGTAEQRAKWLPLIAAGDCLPTIAVTEEQSGGHVLGMEATAVREGDDYVLSGRKVFVGSSHIGDLHGVVVRTGPGSEGLTAFLVEADRPGLRLAPHRPAMGLHGFGFGELVFEDCRVPTSNRLGREGEGLELAHSSSILYGRANLAGVALGTHQALWEQTAAYTTETYRYGVPLARQPVVEQVLGRIQSRLMTARTLAYHAVSLLDAGVPCDAELMNAKLVGVELARESAQDAMDLHGGAGLFPDLPVERYFRDVQHLYAPAGTSEVQLLRLARMALGESRAQCSETLADRLVPGGRLALTT